MALARRGAVAAGVGEGGGIDVHVVVGVVLVVAGVGADGVG